jgi:hypothetical protein
MLELGLLWEARLLWEVWSLVVPVRLVIPIWLVVPWLVWPLVPHVSTTVGVDWEVAEVSSCVPVLADWALVFKGKASVTLVEAFAVGCMREVGRVAWILAARTTLVWNSDCADTWRTSCSTSVAIWNDTWWEDNAWRKNDTWWEDRCWNSGRWVVA